MPQLGNSTQQLKRIVVAVNGPVLIPDLKVFLRSKGDSRDLLATEVTGATRISLSDLTESNDLDSLIQIGELDLYDENGNKLTGVTALRATNLATLNDSTGSGGGVDSKLFQEIISVSSEGQSSFTLSSTPLFPTEVLMFVNGNKQETTYFSVAIKTVSWTGFTLKTTDSVCFVYEIAV